MTDHPTAPARPSAYNAGLVTPKIGHEEFQLTGLTGACRGPLRFYVGLHHVNHAEHFERSFISVNTLRNRKSDFAPNDWVLDSGAFTELATYGHYREEPHVYAQQIERWRKCGNMVAAVTQDYMCEPFMLVKTGLTVQEHQCLTIERYLALRDLTDAYVMPVLQGYDPLDYVDHLEAYGGILTDGQWVGVGSVCKRNSNLTSIAQVLSAIKLRRPDLCLHGFGLKTTALECRYIRDMLHSADSMAWSFAARRQGRDANSWREALAFQQRIQEMAA